jgi:hypothetical protein
MTDLDDLADMLIPPGTDDSRTIGTLFFVLSFAAEFVLQPETWPVFMAWYRRSWPGADAVGGLETEGRAELESMVNTARLIGLSGRPPV